MTITLDLSAITTVLGTTNTRLQGIDNQLSFLISYLNTPLVAIVAALTSTGSGTPNIATSTQLIADRLQSTGSGTPSVGMSMALMQVTLNLIQTHIDSIFGPDVEGDIQTALNTIGTYLSSVKERLSADQTNISTVLKNAISADTTTIVSQLNDIRDRISATSTNLGTVLGNKLSTDSNVVDELELMKDRLAPAQHTVGDHIVAAISPDSSVTALLANLRDRLASADHSIATDIGGKLSADSTVTALLTSILARLAPSDHTIGDHIAEKLSADTTVTAVLTTLAGRIAGSGKDLESTVDGHLNTYDTDWTATNVNLAALATAVAAGEGVPGLAEFLNKIAGSLAPAETTPIATSIAAVCTDGSGIPRLTELLDPANDESALYHQHGETPSNDSQLEQIRKALINVATAGVDVNVSGPTGYQADINEYRLPYENS